MRAELPTVAVLIGKNHYQRMLSQNAWDSLRSFADTIEHLGGEPATKPDLLDILPQADACITSWGVAQLDADVIAAAPRLKAMAHMGSSVKRFVSSALWEKGIRVTTTAPALAEDVAITALGLMLVGVKRIWPMAQHVRDGGWRESRYWPSREIRRKVVGIVGASHVGRHLMRLLEPFEVKILLYDPFITSEAAAEIGADKAELEELLSRADIVTLHAPAKRDTHKMINTQRLALMKDDALLINTARGTLIDEAALVVELNKGRFFAFLDVTDPEPPTLSSPLRHLENVVVVPHLAGCIEDCSHLGDMAVEELHRFFGGEPPLYQVKPDMLSRIA
jgi:phosphoglycerate dehydrogenase-like enzyme